MAKLNKATIKMREAIHNNHISHVEYSDLVIKLGKHASYYSTLSNFATTNEENARNISKQFERHLQEMFQINFDYDTPEEIGKKINRYWEVRNAKGTPMEDLHKKVDRLEEMIKILIEKVDQLNQK